MKLALILSDFGERMQTLQRNLTGEFSVIVGRSLSEGMDLLQTLPVDLALVDLESCGSGGEEIAERVREFRPQCAVVAVLPEDGLDGGPAAGFDAALRADSTAYEIAAALEGVMERQRLREELEQQRAEIRRLQARSERLLAARAPAQPVDKLIKAFSRALSSGFDLERLLNLFADTVLEMMRVSKVSVLLQEGEAGEYRVRCYRGLRPDVAEGLRLRSSSGLAAWLAREGRIMTRDLAQGPEPLAEAGKEMDALQAVISIPMLCSGVLVGILNLNGRVTGSPFQEDELETLFTLAGHMAVAVQEMSVVRQMLHQKAYGEQVVAQLGAGVVAIDEHQHVVTYNQRAAEILGKPGEEVLRRDLRRLPSPLGDMLYETLLTGRRYQGEEVLLMPGRVPLVVDTSRLQASDGSVLGSVAVVVPARTPRDEAQRRIAEFSEALLHSIGHACAQFEGPLSRLEAVADALASGESALDPGSAGAAIRDEVQALRAHIERLRPMDCPPYQFQAQAVSDLVGAAVERARTDHGRVPVVAVGLEDLQARVEADAPLLCQALASLTRYAASHAEPDSGVRLSVTSETREDDGAPTPSVVVRISCRQRRRAEPAAAKGNGQGRYDPDLLLGQRIVQDHGGTLEPVRAADRHLCLEVRLPVIGAGAGLREAERRGPLAARSVG